MSSSWQRWLSWHGGKMPLLHAPSQGEEGMQKNLALPADRRSQTSTTVWRMYDCRTGLDLNYATRFAHAAAEYGMK
jgi:L-rhamnonate dehydratase